MSRPIIIKLTKDNYKDFKLHDIIAISIATSNAMGDSGAYDIVSSDGIVYHANPYYEDISMDQLIHVCPFISDNQLDIDLDEPRGWKRFNMGYGNFLYIRNTIIEQFQMGVKQLKDKSQSYLLITVWIDIVLDVVDGRFIEKN